MDQDQINSTQSSLDQFKAGIVQSIALVAKMPSHHKRLAWTFWQQTSAVLENLVSDWGVSGVVLSTKPASCKHAKEETYPDASQPRTLDKSRSPPQKNEKETQTKLLRIREDLDISESEEDLDTKRGPRSQCDVEYSCKNHEENDCTPTKFAEQTEITKNKEETPADKHDELGTSGKESNFDDCSPATVSNGYDAQHNSSSCAAYKRKKTAVKRRKTRHKVKRNSGKHLHKKGEPHAPNESVPPNDIEYGECDSQDYDVNEAYKVSCENIQNNHKLCNEKDHETNDVAQAIDPEQDPSVGSQHVMPTGKTTPRYQICTIIDSFSLSDDVYNDCSTSTSTSGTTISSCKKGSYNEKEQSDVEEPHCVEENVNSQEVTIKCASPEGSSHSGPNLFEQAEDKHCLRKSTRKRDQESLAHSTRVWQEEDEEERKSLSRIHEGYQCQQCDKVFPTRQKAVLHVRQHTGSRPYVCKQCGQRFINRVNMERHEKLHTGERPFACNSCSKAYIEERQLKKHILQVHSNEGSKETPSFPCSECEKVMRTKANLELHVRLCHLGERSFECSQCEKKFQTKSNLRRHESSHAGEKPWECLNCKAVFTQKRSLERHMRTHTGEKPFQCEVCNQGFSTHWSYSQHKLIHSGVRKYLCDLCGKSFLQRSNLMVHYRYHKNVRKFKCEVCDNGFITKGDLERHHRTHTGERPYLCQICPKSFTRLKYLNDHLNVHTCVNPYVCPGCRRSFTDECGYYRHVSHCLKATMVSTSHPTTEDQADELETDSDLLSNEEFAGVAQKEAQSALGTITFLNEVPLDVDPSEPHQGNETLPALQTENTRLLADVSQMETNLSDHLVLTAGGTSQQSITGTIALPALHKPGTVTVVRVNGSDHNQAVNLIRESFGTVAVPLAEAQENSEVSSIPAQLTWDLTNQNFPSQYVYNNGHS